MSIKSTSPLKVFSNSSQSISCEELPAHEIIEDVCNNIIALQNDNEQNPEELKLNFSKLGIDPSDDKTVNEMSALLATYNLCKKDIVVLPLNTGIFKLSVSDKGEMQTIGVFKVGRKRATME